MTKLVSDLSEGDEIKYEDEWEVISALHIQENGTVGIWIVNGVFIGFYNSDDEFEVR